ncbi:MAG: tyrosine-type recombinase/integrase [Pseudomonadota bacterium]
MKNRITGKLLSALPASSSNPLTVYDTDLAGFQARIGRKTVFYLSYRNHEGTRRNFRIGDAAKWNALAARKEAQRLIGKIRGGEDPHAERVAERAKDLSDADRIGSTYLNDVYKPLVLDHRVTGEQTYKRLINAWGHLLDRDMASLTMLDIERTRRDRLKKGIKRSTLNRDFGTLRTMLRHAVRTQVLDKYPIAGVRALKESDDARVRYLTPVERKRLLAALEQRRDYLRPWVILALNTGMRRGEMLKLQWGDISFVHDRITVRGVTTKIGKVRHIPLNHTAKAILQEWRGLRSPDPAAYVFPGKNGNRMKQIHGSWGRLMDQAGIDEFRVHDMRHDFASQLVMKGVDLYTVQKLMGHASVQMTERYAHLAPDHLRTAVEVIDG